MCKDEEEKDFLQVSSNTVSESASPADFGAWNKNTEDNRCWFLTERQYEMVCCVVVTPEWRVPWCRCMTHLRYSSGVKTTQLILDARFESLPPDSEQRKAILYCKTKDSKLWVLFFWCKTIWVGILKLRTFVWTDDFCRYAKPCRRIFSWRNLCTVDLKLLYPVFWYETLLILRSVKAFLTFLMRHVYITLTSIYKNRTLNWVRGERVFKKCLCEHEK